MTALFIACWTIVSAGNLTCTGPYPTRERAEEAIRSTAATGAVPAGVFVKDESEISNDR